MITTLVVTVTGVDRPGIVSQLSDRARGFGANWAASRMAGLAGQFAGIVRFDVPTENAEGLTKALSGLDSSGLRIAIARGDARAELSQHRTVALELVGQDRPGIVRDLSLLLAERGVSIDELHTELVSAPMSAEHLFRVTAALAVPDNLPDDELRSALEALANEMMVDIAIGEPAPDAMVL